MEKKTHTYKNTLIIEMPGRKVSYLSPTYEGKKQEKRICDEEGYIFPENALLFKDSGFQGFEPERVITYQPRKKPRGQDQPWEAQFRNAIISSRRIAVEHVIAGVKRARIVKDRFRNTKALFADQVMAVACGLHNFRTDYRHPVSFDVWSLFPS